MKQELSRFRAQRLRERLRESALRGTGEINHWNQHPAVGWVIGLLLWLATCAQWLNGTDWSGIFQTGSTTLLTQGMALLLGCTVLSALVLRVLDPAIFLDNSRILLLAMSCLMAVIPAGLLRQFPNAVPFLAGHNAPLLAPFPLAPLLTGLLLGAPAAIVAGLWTSLTSMILLHDSRAWLQSDLGALFAGLIASVVIAILVPRVRRRTQIIRIGLLATLCQAVVALTQFNHLPPNWSEVLYQFVYCVISCTAAAMIVIVSLPFFEKLFGITTNITLLELSDLGHPLLQRLAFEAPGTYHHSLMVANLAHAAADAIQANVTLARVGAYFHDIGKLTKAKYFTENIQDAENPHDELAPSMSALIVMGHVKEGLSLAMLHKLPGAVMEIIEQHHGTGLAAYFHHKAGQQAQGAAAEIAPRSRPAAVDETPYRYPGPRPLSREAVIIMLADAVEAASRSLDKPSPGHITELVDRLVDSRFEDGQLDDCEMELAELAQVKKAFVSCLTNMLHSRIAYPKL